MADMTCLRFPVTLRYEENKWWTGKTGSRVAIKEVLIAAQVRHRGSLDPCGNNGRVGKKRQDLENSLKI